MTAKDSLAQTLNVVAALNDQLSNLKSEYAYFQQLAKESSAMAQEEILSTRCVCVWFKLGITPNVPTDSKKAVSKYYISSTIFF